jgi:hypothetical protein
LFTSDRQYISQYAQDFLGFMVTVANTPTEPDDDLVTIAFTSEDTGTQIFSRAGDRVGVGMYQTTLSSVETSVPGNYRVACSYAVGGVAQMYGGLVQVGTSAPAYDGLAPGFKNLVDQVWARFADLFDSPDGGPNLETYFQSNFNRGRIAQMMQVGLGTLNTVSQPFQTYTVDGSGGSVFPLAQWGALLERATYVEVLKHLRRSYVEQPMFQGGSVTRLDRRDYMQRWGEILQDEQATLKSQLDTYKLANMNLGKPAVLVSGGIFGRYGPTRFPTGMAAARGYFFNGAW